MKQRNVAVRRNYQGYIAILVRRDESLDSHCEGSNTYGRFCMICHCKQKKYIHLLCIFHKLFCNSTYCTYCSSHVPAKDCLNTSLSLYSLDKITNASLLLPSSLLIIALLDAHCRKRMCSAEKSMRHSKTLLTMWSGRMASKK